MVKLIPDILAPEIKSNAEKSLFIEFRDHESDRKCVILHSLGIAEHKNNIFGEIDFVVICKEGVLCIEVKGGETFQEPEVYGGLQTGMVFVLKKAKALFSRFRGICILCVNI